MLIQLPGDFPTSPVSPCQTRWTAVEVNHEMTQKELEEISQQKMDVPSGPAPPAGSNPGVQSQLELLLHKALRALGCLETRR